MHASAVKHSYEHHNIFILLCPVVFSSHVFFGQLKTVNVVGEVIDDV